MSKSQLEVKYIVALDLDTLEERVNDHLKQKTSDVHGRWKLYGKIQVLPTKIDSRWYLQTVVRVIEHAH